VREYLDSYGVRYELAPTLVRGLDYYTRTTFEFIGPDENANSTICGGGRYDGLARELGWPDTPAVGFAAGLERVLASMESEGESVVAPAPAELLVVPEGAALSVAASAVARVARAAVPTAVDYSDRSIKAKMRSANRLGVRWVAVLNAAEADRQVVQLRDMASKEQSEVSWAELPEKLA
jgi:histidyl-tRNA synthetase